MNKKANAGDWMLFIPLLLTMIITSMAVIVMIYFFFGEGYDFRSIDSASLNFKISNCLEKNPAITTSEEIFEKCSLNKEVIERDYLILIKENEFYKIKIGRGDETECALSDKNPEFLKCTTSKIISNGKEIILITGTTQDSRSELV